MKVSYNKLWKKLIDLSLSKTQLRELSGISTVTLAKLSKNQTVSMEALIKICTALRCDLNDICEFIQDTEPAEM